MQVQTQFVYRAEGAAAITAGGGRVIAVVQLIGVEVLRVSAEKGHADETLVTVCATHWQSAIMRLILVAAQLVIIGKYCQLLENINNLLFVCVYMCVCGHLILQFACTHLLCTARTVLCGWLMVGAYVRAPPNWRDAQIHARNRDI